ncbi:MAG: cellulase family glycosylhydrolase, partial [Prevotellaceae bacterium]|nr:cellulase family glycosylhydrolase [Prevotellaceae bacterium]
LTINNLVIPEDKTPNRILIAVHSYDPWDYAGSGKHSEWGHTGKDIVPGTDESTYTGMLDRLYEKYVKNGIPVYFGEFGCVHRTTEHAEAFRKYYLEYVCKAFRDHKMGAFFWDNGYDLAGDDAFGLINHGNGEWIANGEEIVKLMVGAFCNNDSTYTLQSIYDRAPEE